MWPFYGFEVISLSLNEIFFGRRHVWEIVAWRPMSNMKSCMRSVIIFEFVSRLWVPDDILSRRKHMGILNTVFCVIFTVRRRLCMRSGHVLKTDFESGFRKKWIIAMKDFPSNPNLDKKLNLSPVNNFRPHHFLWNTWGYEIITFYLIRFS